MGRVYQVPTLGVQGEDRAKTEQLQKGGEVPNLDFFVDLMLIPNNFNN